ncbi:hypothetical protein [Nocardia sp. NPDC051832]|uniref:hypothetical protein n=1 Tax=Nocardia sp. NPDC051832 TaxID=3155673 RepID=UPI003438D3F5
MTAVLGAVVLLAGCDSATPDTSGSRVTLGAALAASAPHPDCLAPPPITNPDLADFAAALQLPAEAYTFAVRFGASAHILHVDLCVPAAESIDDLRAPATSVAHALKKNSLGSQIDMLVVTDAGGVREKYKSYLVDRSFQTHSWDGTPAEEAMWEIYSLP